MSLLNVYDAVPPQLWAVIRLLAVTSKPLAVEVAHAMVQPPTLVSEGKDDKTFHQTVRTLRELGLVTIAEDGVLRLDGHAVGLKGDDFAKFRRALRAAVLDETHNVELAEQPTAGPKDLTSVLAALLVRDPLDGPVTWQDVESALGAVFDPHATDPTPNDTRWNRFGHWAPALGLAAPPLVPTTGKSPLVSDCMFAVRQTVLSLWAKGDTVSAQEFLRVLRTEIPVLPGGAFSKALRLPDPGSASADPALSFALLRGEYEGWIRLDRNADAPSAVTVADRDRPNRRVTDVVILEDDLG